MLSIKLTEELFLSCLLIVSEEAEVHLPQGAVWASDVLFVLVTLGDSRIRR
jgi:hypothetical protein